MKMVKLYYCTKNNTNDNIYIMYEFARKGERLWNKKEKKK